MPIIEERTPRFRAQCDHCGRLCHALSFSVVEAESAALKSGWEVSGPGGYVCGQCLEDRKKAAAQVLKAAEALLERSK